MFENRRVLVTGGAGLLGTNLIKKLVSLNANVTATIHNKKPQFQNNAISYVQGNLEDKSFCSSVAENQDYVFMCAANSSGAMVMDKKPLTHVTPNVIMNSLMLEAAYAASVKKFVFLSSTTVYPLMDRPSKEEDLLSAPLFDKYFCVAWMKVFSEKLCEMYAAKIKNPMQTIVVRAGNFYGPYDDFEWETSHVIPALIRRSVERHDPMEIWGDGSEVKDLIYVEDLVDGLLLATEKLGNFEILNIASGEPTNLKNVLYWILQHSGYTHADIHYDTSKPQMLPWRLIDISKAKKLLNFAPTIPLGEGLKRTINWYKASNNG